MAAMARMSTMENNTQGMTMFMSGTFHLVNNTTPLSHVLVTYKDGTAFTDVNGNVSFENVDKGNQLIETYYNHQSLAQQVNVVGQTTTVQYGNGTPIATHPHEASSLLYGLLALLVFVAAGLAGIHWYAQKHKEYLNHAKKPHTTLMVLAFLLAIGFTGYLIVSPLQEKSHVATLAASTLTASSVNTTLPIPQTPTIEQDDRNVILTWGNPTIIFQNPGDILTNDKSPGWIVYWGLCNNSSCSSLINPAMKLTNEPVTQLQPLTNGLLYGAYIETVGFDGSVSSPTSIVSFHSDPTRVNQLRTQMTGFFDDFNQPFGPFDELKWNNATSGCVGHETAAQFINTQFHAHNRISDVNCDRGQNISRPRSIFDFTNRTGTLVFDMDGAGNRDKWYLDFTPAGNGIIDNPGHIALDNSDPGHSGAGNSRPTPPNNTLRIVQGANQVQLFVFDQQGWEVAVGTQWPVGSGQFPFGKLTTGSCGNDLRFCATNLQSIKNVRRHWIVTINRDSAPGVTPVTIHVQVKINSILVAEATNVPFPEEKAYMNWVLFSYNTSKSNEPTSLLHWDTFGFDGPSSTIETHNYTDGNRTPTNTSGGSGYDLATSGHPIIRDVKIPDSIAGATAARLMYTVQMPGFSIFNYNTSDSIQINNKTYSAPDPRTFSWNAGITPDGIVPEPVVINIPLADLSNIKQGDNTVTFNLTSSGAINVHMEFDFFKGQAPTYTQPQQIWNYSTDNFTNDIGPAVTIDSIGGTYVNGVWKDGAFGACCWTGGISTDPTNSNVGTIKNPAPAVSGAVPIYTGASGELAVIGTGSNPGITELDYVIDRQRVFAKQTNVTLPAATIYNEYLWDTTKVCNGVHEVFPLAFNPNGTPSVPNYFQGDTPANGYYFPIFIQTNNAGQAACSALGAVPTNLNLTPQFPVISGTPTPSTTLLPTATATPTLTPPSPTNTPVPPSPTTIGRRQGDLNPTPDGKVCIDDLSILAKDWGRGPNATPPTTLFNPLSDINGDGIVNISDLSLLAKNWGC